MAVSLLKQNIWENKAQHKSLKQWFRENWQQNIHRSVYAHICVFALYMCEQTHTHHSSAMIIPKRYLETTRPKKINKAS